MEGVPGEPKPKTVLADLDCRSVDAELGSVKLIHRGKYKTLSEKQREWLKRRQAVEPIIGHVKQEHGLRRCRLKGANGDALIAVLRATGFSLRWLPRAIAPTGHRASLVALASARKKCGFRTLFPRHSPAHPEFHMSDFYVNALKA
ncbi:transposase [Burkholderia ubonensis]|uniref:transposase n=1 Tax=Burkholderia ubonensis TaxID=101571 RepID=UPI0012F828FF|nr:transposase [Burkholderia ubonensis]